MELKQQRDIEKLNNITHTVRSAQAVLQYGVGAMVDFPDQTLMTAAPEYWEFRVTRIHDERLEKKLGVDYFGMPGHSEANKYDWGIAYVRFPQWYFCPKCRRFQPLQKWLEDYCRKSTRRQIERDPYMTKPPRCMECKKDLVPTRIVVACEKGHINDFPWEQWVHHKNRSESRKVCSNPMLTFTTGATASAGLEGLVVRCRNCNSKANLTNAFDKDTMQSMEKKYGKEEVDKSYACSGYMPWKNKNETCDLYPRAMQRGASSLYFPKIESSLVIPPYSDKVNSLIFDSEAYKNCLSFIKEFDDEEREEMVRARIDGWSSDIGREQSIDVNVVKYALNRRLLESNDDQKSADKGINYRIEEYKALTGMISSKELKGNDFIREETDIADYDEIPFLKRVSLVHKVREVRALTGFTRINPPDAHDSGENVPGFMSVKEPETRWFPAYEVRGEGIFIEFDHEKINQWITEFNQVNKRADMLNDNYSVSYQGSITSRNITPKFILLHTIAHLLIRQLSFECGYTAASLRERIYCNIDESGYEMSGILIYTSSGDSEGTLGGLVRQGYWDSFPRIFRKAIEYGELCSNDPVCISSEGQGRDALNLAACHSCVLLPETSCEEFNLFLDRGLVVGTFEDSSIGLYSDLLKA